MTFLLILVPSVLFVLAVANYRRCTARLKAIDAEIRASSTRGARR